MPAAPAEARRLTPYSTHAVEGHQRRGDPDDDDQGVGDAAQDARLRHVLARHQIVGRVQLEAAQVDDRPDLERGARDPRDEHDEGDEQQMLKDVDLARPQRRDAGRHEQEYDDERKPARAAGARDQRAEKQLSAGDQSPDQPEQELVHQPGREHGQGEDGERCGPVGYVVDVMPETVHAEIDAVVLGRTSIGD